MTTGKKNNKMLFILIIPSLALLMLALYLKTKNNTNQTVLNDSINETPLPEVKLASDTIESKSTIYEMENNRYSDQIKEDEKKKQDLDDLLGMVESKEKQQNTPEPVVVQPTQTVKKTTKKTSTTKTVTQNTSKTPVDEQPKTENENNYGFGVYVAKDKKTSSSSQSAATGSYIPAFLEEATTIKNNSQLVFILKQDATINGMKFKKMSTLFGKAKFNYEYVDIRINSIQNAADGQTYPVNLIGFNEKYQRGIFYEGKLDKAASEITDETLEGAAGNTPGGLAGGVARGTVRALRGDEKVNLYEGYKMFFSLQTQQ